MLTAEFILRREGGEIVMRYLFNPLVRGGWSAGAQPITDPPVEFFGFDYLPYVRTITVKEES